MQPIKLAKKEAHLPRFSQLRSIR